MQEQQSYWSYVKQQFRQNRRAVVSLYIVIFLSLIGFFADFLANDKPIIVKHQGQWQSPIFQYYGDLLNGKKTPFFDWQNAKCDFVIRPLIPYHPKRKDRINRLKSPFSSQNVTSFRWRHWFGVSKDGHDIAAGMIHGTRIALSVGIIAMLIAAFIGILLGGLAGFFGDNQLKTSRIGGFIYPLFLIIAFFYGIYVRRYSISDASSTISFIGQLFISVLIIFAIFIIGWLLVRLFNFIPLFAKKINIPLDIIISRIIEVFNAIPTLVFILAFVALLQKASIFNIMVIIGLVSWTAIARFIRGELLTVRSLPYIEAAHALGFSKWRVMFRHAIPNALSPVLITLSFGIAASILLEAGLSFLNLSSTPITMSWGGILKLGRNSPDLWWLTLFPGLAIFITVTCFNLIGEGLTDALDPKLKK